MDNLEPKKLALIRILQILWKYSDFDHPMTQEEIAAHLEADYGIAIERKAVSRNLSLLKEAGFDIESWRNGSCLVSRDFEDAELRLLIDGVLSSRHITAAHTKDLIERLCGLSNRYFKSHVKHVCSVNDWGKTDNQALFYNIEIVDEAIEKRLRVVFDYNKYGADKKLHNTAAHIASPYQLLLHNQRYYLMALNERWHNMAYYRLDRITNIRLSDKKATPLRSVEGYESGVNYKELSTSLPYMYTDRPQKVELIADESAVDQIVDWFGTGIAIEKLDDAKLKITLRASLYAMEHWALQYLGHVEVTAPEELRERIKDLLQEGAEKYR